MHDCSKLQEKLFDLALNELAADEQTQILAHVAACSLCQGELDSLEKTLLLYDQAASFKEPTATEWSAYEQNLRHKVAPQETASKAFWQRFFLASIQIPAPVFAAAVLLFGIAAFFGLRSLKQDAPQSFAETVQSPVQTSTPTPLETPEKTIVREERIVTKKIYVTRRSSLPKQAKPVVAESPVKTNLNPLNLAEFKPVRPISPTVVKGSSPK